ncbi:MAG: hypothetical protein EP332_01905 [Bacteroidetes bacterium]|nr:MAG: hypothetical protein EP332_01905 [Bacteroidota bacterium]
MLNLNLGLGGGIYEWHEKPSPFLFPYFGLHGNAKIGKHISLGIWSNMSVIGQRGYLDNRIGFLLH